MQNDYESLLIKKPKKYFILVVFLATMIITILIILSQIKTYDIYHLSGIIQCNGKCTINVNVKTLDLLHLNEAEFLRIAKKKYDFNIVDISEVNIDFLTNTNFQSVVMYTELDESLQINNLVVDIYVYTNKEVVIRKLINRLI